MDEYKHLDNLPPGFWYALGGEIVSIFGITTFDVEDHIRHSDFIGGTAGLNMAIRMTCCKMNLVDFWIYYDGLDWYDSDELDGVMVDRSIKAVKSTRHGYNDYYSYLVSEKEWDVEWR